MKTSIWNALLPLTLFLCLITWIDCFLVDVSKKRVDSSLQISSYLSETSISKPTFEGTEEIRISFQTGSAANVENSVIDVSLFQIENGKFGKKYNIIGNIAVIGGFNRPVAWGHEYTITFTPPTFLSAGEYLISSILITPQLGSQKAIIHDVTEVKFMYQAGRSTQSIIGEQTSAPTPDSEPKMAGGQSESIIDNRPFMKKVLNSLKSPAEVCRFCSSSKSLNSACDDIFQIPYPTDLIPEDTKLPENAKLLTTKRLCSIANIEDRTLRLAFKYWDKSHYVLETAIRHPMPNLIPGNSANPEFSIWTHPLLEIEYNHFVASFLNGVTQYFMHKYNPALEPGASVRDVAIPDGKLVPWDVLKNRIMKIKEEITSSKYISNCAKYIEVRTDENRVIMNWFLFRAGLVMLKSDLSPEVVSIFENWDDAGEKDKIEVLQKIGGW